MTRFLRLLPVLLLVSGTALAAPVMQEDDRTVNRTPAGVIEVPDRLRGLPEFFDLLPLTSNHDPQNQHPAQWQGQDWATENWNRLWTPEIAVRKLYANGTFQKQSVRNKNIAVLHVGPTFYKLSDLDRRRSLKLLADYNKVFDGGYSMIELRDWSRDEVIGSYTPKGLYLN